MAQRGNQIKRENTKFQSLCARPNIRLLASASIAYGLSMTENVPQSAITRHALLKRLTDLGLAHTTFDHPPIFTVAEGAHIKAKMPGGHTKNLFLKDKAGTLFLISAIADTVIPINKLHPILGSKRLSFGKAELLFEMLGVTPGSVTVFAVMNDKAHNVQLILDAALFEHDIVNFHPMKNDATTAISPKDLLTFVRSEHHEPVIIDFKTLQPVR